MQSPYYIRQLKAVLFITVDLLQLVFSGNLEQMIDLHDDLLFRIAYLMKHAVDRVSPGYPIFDIVESEEIT